VKAFAATIPMACLLSALCGEPVWADHPAGSEGGRARTHTYRVYVRGIRAGTHTITRRIRGARESPGMVFEGRTRMRLGFPPLGVQVDRRERASFSLSGRLEDYHLVEIVNRRTNEVTACRGPESVQICRRERNAATLSNVPVAAFDHITVECPERTLRNPGEQATWRVLDLERAVVRSRTYRGVGALINPAPEIGPAAVRGIRFADAAQTGSRWITEDEWGLLLIRQESTLAGGGLLRLELDRPDGAGSFDLDDPEEQGAFHVGFHGEGGDSVGCAGEGR
jgi:hypothetical protein